MSRKKRKPTRSLLPRESSPATPDVPQCCDESRRRSLFHWLSGQECWAIWQYSDGPFGYTDDIPIRFCPFCGAELP